MFLIVSVLAGEVEGGESAPVLHVHVAPPLTKKRYRPKQTRRDYIRLVNYLLGLYPLRKISY